MKPVRWRLTALGDLEGASSWYAQQGGEALEVRFIDAIQAMEQLLVRHPQVGAARHADLFPGMSAPLRFFPVTGFERCLVYYMDGPMHIEIVRLWHARRGLDALQDE